MRASRPAEQVLRLASSSATPQYVCRACRAQAARQFHTSVPRAAEVPFYQRLRETIFGSKQSQEGEKAREEKQVQRREESQTGNEEGELEVVIGKDGRQYEVAAVIDPTTNRNYIQATNWDGLERVGSEEWVKRRADQGEQYAGFVPKKEMQLTNGQWKIVLYDIMVDILVLQQAGRPVDQVLSPHKRVNYKWQSRAGKHIPTASIDGSKVTFHSLGAEMGILRMIPTEMVEEASEETSTPDTESPAPVPKRKNSPEESDGLDYRASIVPRSRRCATPQLGDVSLHDPAVKMALHKAILKLTGRRVADSALSSCYTLSDLYNHLTHKVKPAKLRNAPEIHALKAAAPNVTFARRRVTMIDKEKKIGRWKVIEEELLARGLPVTGSRWQNAKTVVH